MLYQIRELLSSTKQVVRGITDLVETVTVKQCIGNNRLLYLVYLDGSIAVSNVASLAKVVRLCDKDLVYKELSSTVVLGRRVNIVKYYNTIKVTLKNAKT